MKKWRRFEIRSSTFWKSVYKCGAGTQWRTGTVSGSVKTHPHDCFCSKRFVSIAPPIKSEQDPGVRDGHRVGRYGIKRGARMASDKYCAPPLPLQNLAPVLTLNIREISNSEVVFFNVSGNTCDVARTWSVNLRCSCSYNLKTRLVSQHSTGHSIKPTILFLACIRLNVT